MHTKPQKLLPAGREQSPSFAEASWERMKEQAVLAAWTKAAEMGGIAVQQSDTIALAAIEAVRELVEARQTKGPADAYVRRIARDHDIQAKPRGSAESRS